MWAMTVRRQRVSLCQWLVVLGLLLAATAQAQTVADDAVTIVAGSQHTVAAPGLLANDDPLPAGLHLHFETTLASVSLVNYVSISDDGSYTLNVPGTTAPGTYALAYCMGPSTTEGTACTSNEANITVTVVAPTVADDAVTIVAGSQHTVAAPGLLANDDPLPAGLHLHFETTLASVSTVSYVSISDDGSYTLNVPGTTAPGMYALAYCMGPSTTEGTACTSNEANITVTVVAPTVADDAVTIAAGTQRTVAAPGLLANDDPLPAGLHLHFETTLASVSLVNYVSISDDGSYTLNVPGTTAPGTYALAYCMGPTAVEGTACTSNVANITVTVVGPPTATGLSPDHGPATGGTVVTVTGTGFVAGQTSVTIGGTVIPAASVTVASLTSLAFTTPAHASGPVSVTVTTPGGTTAAQTYTYNQVYTIGGVVSGLAGSGLVLHADAGNQNLPVSTNGNFTFPTGVASGTAYVVTVGTQPSAPTQTCTVSNGGGSVANANVTNVAVSCVTTFAVTASAGSNGSISPGGTQSVATGGMLSFTVTPNAGYSTSVGGSCGGTLANGVFTTSPVTANCTVVASFALLPGAVSVPTLQFRSLVLLALLFAVAALVVFRLP